jgi:uncharacterized membrane protein
VFPANVSMALRARKASPLYRVLAWARLPLQIPLVKWAWQSGRQTGAAALDSTWTCTPERNNATPSR